MIALIALAAAATSLQPGELKTFKDWPVGYDNGRACQAVGLLSENDVDGATITVRREACRIRRAARHNYKRNRSGRLPVYRRHAFRL